MALEGTLTNWWLPLPLDSAGPPRDWTFTADAHVDVETEQLDSEVDHCAMIALKGEFADRTTNYAQALHTKYFTKDAWKDARVCVENTNARSLIVNTHNKTTGKVRPLEVRVVALPGVCSFTTSQHCLQTGDAHSRKIKRGVCVLTNTLRLRVGRAEGRLPGGIRRSRVVHIPLY